MEREIAKTRDALASRMAKRTGLYKKDCARLIDAMTEEMNLALKSGEGLHFQHFGKFVYKVRPATQRRDPKTGEWIPVPPATRVKFIPCKDVKYGVVQIPWEDHLSDAQKESDWYKRVKEESEE